MVVQMMHKLNGMDIEEGIKLFNERRGDQNGFSEEELIQALRERHGISQPKSCEVEKVVVKIVKDGQLTEKTIDVVS